ncbi:MAG TPA: glycogen debranching N-terminal domain-containing protein [Thermodesulfobacteriota bacterium]
MAARRAEARRLPPDRRAPAASGDAAERKAQVLTKGAPSVTRGVADAMVIKDGEPFFLCGPDAAVPLEGDHGLGLYYRDCRYVGGYELTLCGHRPEVLVSSDEQGFVAIVELTNPQLRDVEGRALPRQTVGLTWVRLIDPEPPALRESLLLRNYGLAPTTLDLRLEVRSGFEDVYDVRGLIDERPGTVRAPRWTDGTLRLAYDGKDGRRRSVTVAFEPRPDRTEGTAAHFLARLDPGETFGIDASLVLAESEGSAARPQGEGNGPRLATLRERRTGETERWLEAHAGLRSSSLLLDRVLDRSLRDLRMLRTTIGDRTFFAAGIPWFVTLFGRDSLVTALETLAFRPAVAEETLRLLARFQGARVDEWRDEEPGKILHELRVGELARLGEIPHTPYYGTVDATPLFLVLLARHANWTGRLDLFRELRPSVDAALRWMAEYGDRDGDGYIEYRSRSRKGLVNQGWKDSGDAIVNADGSLAEPPIALVEVQGYAYMAKLGLARLFRLDGDADTADRLEREASALRDRFERDYWDEPIGTYVLARQKAGRPAAVVSSNAGHALWSGIAGREHAERTVARLMADDMFSGWGVRTLASGERRYNPVGYHLGTVWPHDNAIIAAGCRAYGFDDAALRIAEGLVQAAIAFPEARLPELFAGFRRDEYGVPVRYPVACHPQAWASGSVPYLLETLLGLAPDAFAGRLVVRRPLLPSFLSHAELRGLRIGASRVDLAFDRAGDGTVSARALRVDGDLDVVVEAGAHGGAR